MNPLRIGLVVVLLGRALIGYGQDTNFQFVRSSISASKSVERIFIVPGSSNNCSESTIDAESLVELTTVALGSSHTILERKYLDALLEEQRLSLSGLVLEETTIAAGCLQGSEAIVFCNVDCIDGKSVLSVKLIDCAEGVQHWIAQGVDVDPFLYTQSISNALMNGVNVASLNGQASLETQGKSIHSVETTPESSSDSPSNLDCSPILYQGYTYDVVQIGNQCWFAENLRSEHYANGSEIPNVITAEEWATTNTGAVAVYEDKASNLTTYGRLYNWYAVNDWRRLCPSGWYVPTDGDYKELRNFLSGPYPGRQMKSSYPAWDGTNTSGFSALAGGYRDHDGIFMDEGYLAFFWSSSADDDTGAWFWELESGEDAIYRPYYYQRSGFSVRCIRD